MRNDWKTFQSSIIRARGILGNMTAVGTRAISLMEIVHLPRRALLTERSPFGTRRRLSTRRHPLS